MKIQNKLIDLLNWRPFVEQKQHKRVTVNATGCPLKDMNYFIFSFLCSGFEPKCGVRFRHSHTIPPEF